MEHEQHGKKRAVYGETLIERLALDLTGKFARGFSQSNLWQMRDFYLAWPILQTASGESRPSKSISVDTPKFQTLSGLSSEHQETRLQRFPLPWSHYVRLLAVRAASDLGVPVVMAVSEREREFLGVRQAAALVQA